MGKKKKKDKHCACIMIFPGLGKYFYGPSHFLYEATV